MASQALEQRLILEFNNTNFSSIANEKNSFIDNYVTGTTKMYSGPINYGPPMRIEPRIDPITRPMNIDPIIKPIGCGLTNNSYNFERHTIIKYTPPEPVIKIPEPEPFRIIDFNSQNNNQIGLIDSKPFQFGYDLPETGTQFHFHGPNKNNLSYGKLKDYSGNTLFEEKDSFNLAMNDLRFSNGGFKKFP